MGRRQDRRVDRRIELPVGPAKMLALLLESAGQGKQQAVVTASGASGVSR